MSVSDEDKMEIAAIVDQVFCHRSAELCDNILTDFKNCVENLLLQLGPLLAQQNGKAIQAMLDTAKKQAMERREADKSKEQSYRVIGFKAGE